ncbi:hypothetical protein PHYBLDRAFT_172484 [Phycomyces blakesleeanus NRRL 1555(-)]|uniref:Uncharacterized protein n=1 Tax=Phycomyces blakesleeanus (strain ATCC 8743b / DSM 1359 / FGSC 10004 / NBRC 33097 / NRRL 1555) TaxID=763407 RepID=A0A162ZV83_PHYB8|nr:hypothetical protein PHYBLDRAFT_172484 [Phycomyces blakesleeanus NRRL 1555(-)]OAD69231.1 hypothetical protein PHYBLDRAFT_172484 [Phycomyces blakesleeanus NRRL 1555(-)]|eukprot:XP_018287271.1 hypothetical protein PHYBLDRAFT_172484 [Phycomyces blakesleeanus NRRL 1555(-)]
MEVVFLVTILLDHKIVSRFMALQRYKCKSTLKIPAFIEPYLTCPVLKAVLRAVKKNVCKFILPKEHKLTSINFIGNNPSATYVEVTEQVEKPFHYFKVSPRVVHSFIIDECFFKYYSLELKNLRHGPSFNIGHCLRILKNYTDTQRTPLNHLQYPPASSSSSTTSCFNEENKKDMFISEIQGLPLKILYHMYFLKSILSSESIGTQAIDLSKRGIQALDYVSFFTKPNGVQLLIV